MQSRMETFYCGPGRKVLYKTGIGAIMESSADTWADFKSRRKLEVPAHRATFLLDYYNRRGDLSDTIFLDDTGYAAITGEKVKTEAQYRKIDSDYWRKTKAERQKQAA